MLSFTDLSLPLILVLFATAAAVVLFAGVRLARLADELADLTGLGEAVTGAVFLGASTSLSGLFTSMTAAWNDFPELAVSNCLGGIAVQTAFLAVADIAYRKANLEHASASLVNVLQGTILLALLSVPLLATTLPEVTFFDIHPATPLMFAGYGYGLFMISRSRHDPMWKPTRTKETQMDEVDGAQDTKAPADANNSGDVSSRRAALVKKGAQFALLALTLAAAGWLIARSGMALMQKTGMSETPVGALITGVATSLPELVTVIATVRHGAPTLAVGNIIGGNVFDTLFLAASDIAYRGGSIFHQMSDRPLFLIILSMLMTTVLVAGLVRRQAWGIGGIGFESFLILVFYAGGAIYMFV